MLGEFGKQNWMNCISSIGTDIHQPRSYAGPCGDLGYGAKHLVFSIPSCFLELDFTVVSNLRDACIRRGKAVMGEYLFT